MAREIKEEGVLLLVYTCRSEDRGMAQSRKSCFKKRNIVKLVKAISMWP